MELIDNPLKQRSLGTTLRVDPQLKWCPQDKEKVFVVSGKGDLHSRWVQHDSNLSSNRLRRKVTSESASDNTIGSVCSADLAPIDSEFVSKLVGGLCLGDKGNLLSQVEIDFVLRIHTLDFDQTNIIVLVSETSLVPKDGTINMKLRGSRRHGILNCG